MEQSEYHMYKLRIFQFKKNTPVKHRFIYWVPNTNTACVSIRICYSRSHCVCISTTNRCSLFLGVLQFEMKTRIFSVEKHTRENSKHRKMSKRKMAKTFLAWIVWVNTFGHALTASSWGLDCMRYCNKWWKDHYFQINFEILIYLPF